MYEIISLPPPLPSCHSAGGSPHLSLVPFKDYLLGSESYFACYLDVLSIQRGGADAAQLLISPVHPVVQEVIGKVDRPAQISAHHNLPLGSVHACTLNLRTAANLRPQHQPDRSKQRIYHPEV